MTEPAPKPSRLRRLCQNLALFCGTFLLCVAGFEGVLRLNHYGNLEIYDADPALYWKLKPNQDCYTKVNRQPVHINAHGTRGPDFTDRKPAGTFRVLSLGDSRTFGWGLSEAETYSARLGALLEARLPGRKVEVINAGVNAWSYPQMLVYLRETGMRYQPDVVILGEANLWTQFSEKSSPEFARQFMRRVRLKNLLRRFAIYHYVVEVKLEDFYQRNRSKFIPVDPRKDELFKDQQQKDPDALFREAIRGICTVAAAGGAKPVIASLPTFDELIATNPSPVLEVKRAACRDLGAALVDVGPALRAQPESASRHASAGKALYLEGDPVHFTSLGNEIIARQLLEAVAPPSAPAEPAKAR